MPALSFKAQFAPLVESGQKRQTIRAWRKRPIKVGQRLYLYAGMRTKACRKLGESECTEAIPIEIQGYSWDARLGQVVLWHEFLLWQYEVRQIAVADGFETVEEFFKFFSPDGEKFEGQLIKWGDPIS